MLPVSWPLLRTVNAADPIPVGHNDADGDSIVNLDLDSDNDGWPDLREAGVSASYDVNGDARIDASPGGVGNDGIADILQSVNDQACCDLDGDGRNDLIPINTDSADLPDFQDLDSDNDGIHDIIELGGSDSDNNGHVDNFVDVLGGKDGTDDGLLAFPYSPRDANGNGVFDHVEYIPSGSAENDGEAVDVVPDAVGLQPQADDPPPADEASQGVILTGLNASGCSIASSASNPLLYLLTIISIAMLGRRNTLRRWPTPNQESKIAS